MSILRAGCTLLWLFAGAAQAQEATPGEPVADDGFKLQLGLQPGYAFGFDSREGTNSGPGGRIQLLARFNPYLAVGTDLAIYAGAGYEGIVRLRDGGGENTVYSSGPTAQLAGVLRLGIDRGAVRPAVLVGPAVFSAMEPTESFDTYYFLGGELGFDLGRVPLFLDVRYYQPLMDEGGADHPDFLTLGLGTRFSL